MNGKFKLATMAACFCLAIVAVGPVGAQAQHVVYSVPAVTYPATPVVTYSATPTVTYRSAPVVTTYRPAPIVTAPVVTTYRPAPIVTAPVLTTYYRPAPIVTAPVVTTYRPAYPVVSAPVVVGQPVVVRTTEYVPGQPIRNLLRAITP